MIEPIGFIQSPYKDKFGVPRQPHLVSEVGAQIVISFTVCPPDAFDGLEEFNFIWLISIFHQAHSKNSKVRPPRLGGNKKIGVFATRSSFRPNPLALSLVKLSRIEIDQTKKRTILHVHGIDLIDQTPVLDIKPYIKEHDSSWEPSTRGWLEEHSLVQLKVHWDQECLQSLRSDQEGKHLEKMIESVLSWDPRPAYHDEEPERLYHLRLEHLDIHFTVQSDQVKIVKIDL